jgi:hypothetical protein
MEEHERMAMVDSLMYRREEGGESPIQYTAPGAEQKWRARDLLDIHWNLTGIKCPESFNRIMSCIIGHANPDNGVCFPGQTTIGIETGCSRRTVQRGIDWWTKKKFLTTESRGLGHALAYHPQWELFELYYIAAADDIAAQKEALRVPCVTKGAHACVTKGAHDERQHADAQNLKVLTSKVEPHPERAQSPSASDASASLEEKEASREEKRKRAEAEARLNHDLSASPFYYEVLGWIPPTVHTVAVEAELATPHAGAEFALAAYRKHLMEVAS